MNLTDLMSYNNNSGAEHYHKSPRVLQEPVTGSWRPRAIIILDLRPLSKAGRLCSTGTAHPCCCLRGIGWDGFKDTAVNMNRSWEERREKLICSWFLSGLGTKEQEYTGTVYWGEGRRFQYFTLTKNETLTLIVFIGCIVTDLSHIVTAEL